MRIFLIFFILFSMVSAKVSAVFKLNDGSRPIAYQVLSESHICNPSQAYIPVLHDGAMMNVFKQSIEWIVFDGDTTSFDGNSCRTLSLELGDSVEMKLIEDSIPKITSILDVRHLCKSEIEAISIYENSSTVRIRKDEIEWVKLNDNTYFFGEENCSEVELTKLHLIESDSIESDSIVSVSLLGKEYLTNNSSPYVTILDNDTIRKISKTDIGWILIDDISHHYVDGKSSVSTAVRTGIARPLFTLQKGIYRTPLSLIQNSVELVDEYELHYYGERRSYNQGEFYQLKRSDSLSRDKILWDMDPQKNGYFEAYSTEDAVFINAFVWKIDSCLLSPLHFYSSYSWFWGIEVKEILPSGGTSTISSPVFTTSGSTPSVTWSTSYSAGGMSVTNRYRYREHLFLLEMRTGKKFPVRRSNVLKLVNQVPGLYEEFINGDDSPENYGYWLDRGLKYFQNSSDMMSPIN